MKKKQGRGRPTLYKPEYCELLENHLAQGKSYLAFGAEINVTRETLYEWERVHEEFSDSKKRGILKSLKVWENRLEDGLLGKIPGFNTTLAIFLMKCRFGNMGYRERDVVEVEHSGAVIAPTVIFKAGNGDSTD